MKYAVTAQARDRKTLVVAGKIRTEVVDASSNVLFKSCKTIKDIRETYEAFWNQLNPRSKGVVIVYKVKLLKRKK